MKTFAALDNILAASGCICLFAVMWIVGVDALARNLFGSPIPGVYVLIQDYLMPAMIFPVIGYTWMRRAHVGITLLRERFPTEVRWALQLVDTILALILFGIITKVGFGNLVEAYEKGLVTSGLIRWPIWLALIAMPVGSLVFCVRLIGEIFMLAAKPGRLASS